MRNAVKTLQNENDLFCFLNVLKKEPQKSVFVKTLWISKDMTGIPSHVNVHARLSVNIRAHVVPTVHTVVRRRCRCQCRCTCPCPEVCPCNMNMNMRMNINVN
jgi:hypothetical protein